MVKIDRLSIREDFPILKRNVHGKSLVYLDNAATSQKPKEVISAISEYYRKHNANVHRGIHVLGDESTSLYAEARNTVSTFIGAGDSRELVFVRNATEAINLVAYSWGMSNISKGDVILTTQMEHHSNIVPWQMLAQRVGGRLKYVRVTPEGLLDVDDYKSKLRLKPKLVVLVHVSNFLGTINPIEEFTLLAHNAGARVLVDGAQAVPHLPVDVGELGVDFYAFSGHKMLGPMGIGGLWVRGEILSDMKPFLTGGGTISEVYEDHTVFTNLPDRFDAGTPNVAGAVGLAEATSYLSTIGMKNILLHEQELAMELIHHLDSLGFVTIYGPREQEMRGGLVAFEVSGVHAHDVAQVLDSEGVAVRSGHHCTMLMHQKLGVSGTTRASFALYNTKEDIRRLIEGLHKVKKVFQL